MMPPLRQPARTPPQTRLALPWPDSPQAAVQRWFERIHAGPMQGLPFLNPALSVQALDFRRCEGDWLGAVVTPWSVQLMLVPGGGSLWADTAAGERSMVALPVGRLAFIADEGDCGLPAFQYLPLVNGTAALAGDGAARALARDALASALQPAPGAAPAAGTRHAAGKAAADAAVDAGRRRFLRCGSPCAHGSR